MDLTDATSAWFILLSAWFILLSAWFILLLVDSFRRSAPSQSLEPLKVQMITPKLCGPWCSCMTQTSYTQVSDINHIDFARSYSFPELDLKTDDVMFIEGTGWQSTQQLLCNSPQKIDGGFELKGGYYQIMRLQPLPNSFLWDDPPIFVELYRHCLAGLSNGKHSLFCNTDRWFTDVILKCSGSVRNR